MAEKNLSNCYIHVYFIIWPTVTEKAKEKLEFLKSAKLGFLKSATLGFLKSANNLNLPIIIAMHTLWICFTKVSLPWSVLAKILKLFNFPHVRRNT